MRLVIGMVKPPLPCGGVALSAALTFEDALVEEGKEEPVYWTQARVMAESLRAGRSIVAYRTLPLIRAGRQITGLRQMGLSLGTNGYRKEGHPNESGSLAPSSHRGAGPGCCLG